MSDERAVFLPVALNLLLRSHLEGVEQTIWLAELSRECYVIKLSPPRNDVGLYMMLQWFSR